MQAFYSHIYLPDADVLFYIAPEQADLMSSFHGTSFENSSYDMAVRESCSIRYFKYLYIFRLCAFAIPTIV